MHLERSQNIGKGAGKLGNKRTGEDHPDYSIIKIGNNREKSPGNLRSLAVTPVKKKPSANTGVKNIQKSTILIFKSLRYVLLCVFQINS